MTAIFAEALFKSFGPVPAVSGVSFGAPQGQILGLLGENGAGKTTTMRLLTGYYAPDHGNVRIMDYDLATSRKEAQRQIGYLPEGVPLYRDMRCIDYLKFTADVRGILGAARKKALDRVIADCELESVLIRKIDQLSKGFQRRIGLAQALIADPPVLILDEPSDGLDPNQKFALRKLLRSYAQNKAVIVSTHILEEVAAICDRVLVLHAGKLVADTTPTEFTKGEGMEKKFRQWTGGAA